MDLLSKVQPGWFGLTITFASGSTIWSARQAGKWWSLGDVEVGPFGSRNCFGGECKSTDLSWLGGSERWIRTGIATWAAGLLALLLLVTLSGALAAKRTPRLLAKTALVSVVTATLAGTWFIIQFQGLQAALNVDRGIFFLYGGAAFGLAATISALRLRPLPR